MVSVTFKLYSYTCTLLFHVLYVYSREITEQEARFEEELQERVDHATKSMKKFEAFRYKTIKVLLTFLIN